jgi:hypothetical protein
LICRKVNRDTGSQKGTSTQVETWESVEETVPVQLKVEFWAKEKGKSCRRNNQEQDNEARAAKLERRGKDPGVAPAFD